MLSKIFTRENLWFIIIQKLVYYKVVQFMIKPLYKIFNIEDDDNRYIELYSKENVFIMHAF